MSLDYTTVTHLLTTEQAVAFVKKVDRTNSGKFYLRVRLDAQIEGKPDSIFQDGLCTYLDISRKDALQLVSGMLSAALEARGARITIDEVQYDADQKRTYWIG